MVREDTSWRVFWESMMACEVGAVKLSVLVPVYNERATIDEILRRVVEVELEKEIVVVDDGSYDGTRQYLENLTNCNIRCFFHDINRGKGAAIRTGLSHVTGDIVIIQDADLEYDPKDYVKLLRPILDGKADVVYGSRFVTGDYRRVLYFWHMLGNTLLTFLSNMLSDLNLTDMETCYKAFRREILNKITIEEDRFGFEPEITAKIARLNARIYEVGISYSGRTYAEGKKINWLDGVSALRCILKYNLFC